MADWDLSALRFIMCGSVDDGKSTLIGRLLYESDAICEDELHTLSVDSARYGTQGDRLDLALLVDGLIAERAQGITIDVAHRYFSARGRRFIVADTPGHEQYTRNMATGASTSELAVLLIDARKGLLTQARRHMRIAALMGIRHIVLAVNKMDLAEYSQAVFARIALQAERTAVALGVEEFVAIPVSALEGDNVSYRSSAMPWYSGPTLLDHLEQCEGPSRGVDGTFCMPIQGTIRAHGDFRGVCGRIAGGQVRPGDRVKILPSGVETSIDRIVGWAGDAQEAAADESITVTLGDAVDANRGDVLVASANTVECADQFQCRLLWLGDAETTPGRMYVLKIHYIEVTATISQIRYREDIDTGARLEASTLTANDIALVTVLTARPITFEPYRRNRTLGGFVLIDPLTRGTVGAGMVDSAIHPAPPARAQIVGVGKDSRATQMGQQPRCVWLTGLSGAGKSTIAAALEQRLFAVGRHSYVLDGDEMRHGLNSDLGFSDADRIENIRRVAEVARVMVDAGLIVIVALIAPFRVDRLKARALFSADEFIEVFVDAPLELCEARDPKGLYAKARRGEIPYFTGIDSAYEEPAQPDVHLRTDAMTLNDCITVVLSRLHCENPYER